MRSRRARGGAGWRFLIALAGVASGTLAAQSPDFARPTSGKPGPAAAASSPSPRVQGEGRGEGPTILSPRNASYSIDVELDPARHALSGREVITWRNITANPTREIQLHLYWNAWRNSRSTFLREERLGGHVRDLDEREPGDWGAIDVSAIRLLGLGNAPPIDLTGALRFIAPDTGNTDDRTAASVRLPASVAPGETINLAVEWTANVPAPFARTGRVGDYYFIGQWFPKVAVLGAGGWNTHEFHATAEFYADFGAYDVRITVPTGWVVGATGRVHAAPAVRDGRATHRFRQDDVHDFAWVTSPDLVERRERFTHASLPPVDMRLLLQPEHVSQAERHFAATRAALKSYGEWFGPYPYGHVTIVDPAWRSESGGMEYPTLFTAGTRWLAPAGVTDPEDVTVHEAGHQFWYGLVANNEFEHAWMDEGINQYANARVMAETFAPVHHFDRFFGGFIPWVYRDIVVPRDELEYWSSYRTVADSDTPSTPSWRYAPASADDITYAKTALWLHTLERLLGWPTMQRILSTFFERWRFRHPTPEDFFATANEVSGRDLTWFFDEVYRSGKVFDYAVESVTTEPRSMIGVGDGAARPLARDVTAAANRHDTTVIVRRHGEGVFPVDVEVVFEDGRRTRTPWNGRDRWRALTFDSAAPAVSATIDPDSVLRLDVNRTNNSVTLEPEGERAATRWSLLWLVWLQDRLLTFSIVF
jgi:Peptidase family M1 domain